MAIYTMGELLETLAADEFVKGTAEQPLPAALAPAADSEGSPWYVKALVGVSAWIAAMLMGAFFGLLGVIDTNEEMLIWGVGLLIVAIGMKWVQRRNIFWGQLAFALILAGQGLVIIGMGLILEDTMQLALVIIALEALLLVLYPDSLHRMLSVLAIVGATIFLIYDQQQYEFIHALFLIVAAGVVALWQQELRLLTTRLYPFRAPLGYGLAFALFGLALLAFSGLYPETRWWIASAALLLVLLYLVWRIMRELALSLMSGAALWAIGAVALLAIPAYETPGILAAVIVLLLGRWRGNSLLLGIAAAFLLFFLSTYYYYLEVSLLNKSYILAGTGVALLGAWWVLRRVTEGRGQKSVERQGSRMVGQ